MTTYKQGTDFVNTLLNVDSLLDDAIEWIKSNLSPIDVYDETNLVAWAQTMEPEDIFTSGELAAWAEANGYIEA